MLDGKRNATFMVLSRRWVDLAKVSLLWLNKAWFVAKFEFSFVWEVLGSPTGQTLTWRARHALLPSAYVDKPGNE